MDFFDAHVHYFGDDLKIFKEQINDSKYKNIYLGYSSINFNKLDITEHLSKCSGAFIMPYCIKETDISKANASLNDFVKQNKTCKIYSVPFIDTSEKEFDRFDKFIGFKEHFYLHNSFQYEDRINSYKYLSDKNKLLILHCDNGIRVDYVKFLLEKYPKMNIQVAHLGVFRGCKEASKLVIDELSSHNNVYFDISTIFDTEIIRYALKKNSNNILFGTDVPYVLRDQYIEEYISVIKNCDISNQDAKKLFKYNAYNLLEKISE